MYRRTNVSIVKFNALLWAIVLCTAILPNAVSAKTLKVAVGLSKPPYVISENNSGFELDLVKAIFASMGHQLSFNYVPYARSYQLLKEQKVDVAMTISDRSPVGKMAALSDPYVTYRNVAISLKENQLNITKATDMVPYAIAGFQKSSTLLGEEYYQASQKAQHYVEIANQAQQVEMLKNKRTDILIMDVNIFNYLSKGFFGRDSMSKVDIHSIFPPSHYRLGFHDDQLRDQFNLGLSQYRTSASYIKLVDRYNLY